MNISFERGINSTLFDDKGRDYIDFTSGIGVSSVGHSNVHLIDAIKQQLNKVIHTSNLFKIGSQETLADRINELSGYNMSTFFCNSGAEANEGAIKIARKYGKDNFDKKRYKIITMTNAFHGRTISTLSAISQKSLRKDSFKPYTDGFIYAKDIQDIYNCIDEETVAVMIELIQGEGGIYSFNMKEVQKLERDLKEKKILLIIDEVQTGIFRTGQFLASNLYQLSPDVITLAKGLAGGVPIGAVMTKLKDIFNPNDHGSTFGGNQLSTASALAVLNILEKIKINGNLDRTIKLFNHCLNEFYTNNQKSFIKITGYGLMLGLQVSNKDLYSKIIKEASLSGVLILKSGKDTLRFLPPLTISKKEIQKGFERLSLMMKEIGINEY